MIFQCRHPNFTCGPVLFLVELLEDAGVIMVHIGVILPIRDGVSSAKSKYLKPEIPIFLNVFPYKLYNGVIFGVQLITLKAFQKITSAL